jgi:hypothetical protein
VEGQQLTRLHPCPKHPCQLLFLTLYTHPTRKFNVLLGHDLSTVNDPLEGQPKFCNRSKVSKDDIED